MYRLSLIFLCSLLIAEEIQVDLKNPSFVDGALQTHEGGVIYGEDFRIQAMNICYVGQTIHADGDLMVQYKDKVFVGSELDFDLSKKCGIVYDGKTFSSLWYVGGDEICLHADGSYKVKNAFITTCENKDSSWDLHAMNVNVMKDRLFEAERVRIRLFKRLGIWLPSFRVNLQKFKEPIFRYYVNWNKGPKVGLRYQLYSWENAAVYGRLEYRWKKGWGGAIETEYFPDDKLTSFVTRNYAGTDRLFNGIDVEFRYRFQGAWLSNSKDDRTHAKLTWDKYSDPRMPGDFTTEDFEVSTAKKTIFYLHHRDDDYLTWVKARPKVNPFESIKQDLPTGYVAQHPTEVRNTGVIASGFAKASYLNFSYSTQLVQDIAGYHSPRFEAYEKLTRPFQIQAMTVTPYLAGRGILYGTSPSHETKALGLLDYGAKASFRGTRQFNEKRHVIEPYLRYQALTNPTVSTDDHYIFSIQDGYEKIQEVAVGVRQLLATKEDLFTADLYANAFFDDFDIPQVVPRAYLFLNWELPTVHMSFDNCYNFRDQVWDFSKGRVLWTISEDAALTFEARYRSRFDWRKADHENFILDVTRSWDEMLTSPLSDRRITLLSNLFIRLNPFWELKWESHHGFYRINSEPYNEFKIHLYRWLSSSWKLHLYYGYTVHNHFDWTIGLKLMKKNF